jgi:hypothetical protein
MQTICRLIRLSPSAASSVVATPGSLSACIDSATIYSDVYRYWHAIEFLLARHCPGSLAGNWTKAGPQLSEDRGEVPGARVLDAAQVSALAAELSQVQPDELIEDYDAAAMDAAQVYPATWQAWEEDFDPLGQVLEHYYFLQEFTAQCAADGAALLLYFDELAEGSV